MKKPLVSRRGVWLASLVVLPYLMYGSLLVMVVLMVDALRQRGRDVLKVCRQAGFGWLTVGLLLSASVGLNPGDAFLQLVHFLPFFLLWGVLVTDAQLVSRDRKSVV